MDERCRCGAELLPTLHFCAGCGRDRAPLAIPRPRTGPPAAMPVIPAPRGPAGDTVRRAVPVRPGPRHGVPQLAVPQARFEPQWAPAPAPAAPPAWASAHPHPTASPRRSSTPWIAAALLLVPVLLAGAVLLVLRPGLLPGTARAAAPVTTPVTTPAAVAPAVGAPPATPASPVSPEAALADQITADGARVDATVGYWVPQLSSKRPGTGDGGVSYDSAAILDHYRGLAARYPDAALLWSGDWPVFTKADYWVVVVAEPFGSAAAANAWCDAQGLGSDDCFAKQLSRTGGPQGTTVHR